MHKAKKLYIFRIFTFLQNITQNCRKYSTLLFVTKFGKCPCSFMCAEKTDCELLVDLSHIFYQVQNSKHVNLNLSRRLETVGTLLYLFEDNCINLSRIISLLFKKNHLKLPDQWRTLHSGEENNFTYEVIIMA